MNYKKVVVLMHNFQLGEFVFVAGHGVGQVLAIETKIASSSHKELQYYVVKLISTGAKIQVPTHDERAQIRRLADQLEVDNIYNFLADRENIKFNTQTWNRRYRDYMAKINTGMLREIADVLREMLLIKAEKKLSYSEKRVLELCKEMMVKEIALSTGSQEQTVSDTIETIFHVQ